MRTQIGHGMGGGEINGRGGAVALADSGEGIVPNAADERVGDAAAFVRDAKVRLAAPAEDVDLDRIEIGLVQRPSAGGERRGS